MANPIDLVTDLIYWTLVHEIPYLPPESVGITASRVPHKREKGPGREGNRDAVDVQCERRP